MTGYRTGSVVVGAAPVRPRAFSVLLLWCAAAFLASATAHGQESTRSYVDARVSSYVDARVSIEGMRVHETDGDDVVLFRINLSDPLPVDVTMRYSIRTTSGWAEHHLGRASPGVDFENVRSVDGGSASSVTFPAGSQLQEIHATILDDTRDEHNERIELDLHYPRYPTIAHVSGQDLLLYGQKDGVAVIDDDDPEPFFRFGPGPTKVEGDSGTTRFCFPTEIVDADGRLTTSGKSIRAHWDGRSGTALAWDRPDRFRAGEQIDFIRRLVSGPMWTASCLIGLDVYGDTGVERDETFRVVVTKLTNVSVLPGGLTATATILNDDGFGVRVGSALAVEGSDETIDFAVELQDGPCDCRVTVDWATGDDATAIAGEDYLAASGTLTFEPGDTIKTVSVPLLDDEVYEGMETFKLHLSNPSGATLVGAAATGRIQDNEVWTAGLLIWACANAGSGQDASGSQEGTALSDGAVLEEEAAQRLNVRVDVVPDAELGSMRLELSGRQSTARTDKHRPLYAVRRRGRAGLSARQVHGHGDPLSAA